MKMYVVCTHQNWLIEATLMGSLNIPFNFTEARNDMPVLFPFAT